VKVVVAGGTGFVGKSLVERLAADGIHVAVLTRDVSRARRRLGDLAELVRWDAESRGPWEQSLSGSDAVVNLAGASVAAARWTPARKRWLVESRLKATRALVAASDEAKEKPSVLVNASGVGYYGASDDRILDEQADPGTGFLADLSAAWEAETSWAQARGIRVVRLRIGMVIEKDGGALPRMVLPFRLFLGGPVMPGTQWLSWIHRADLVGLTMWALLNPSLSGPVNAVAPNPVTMTDFCRTVGKALSRPSWFPVPESLLKLALGEMGSLMMTGQRVKPVKAISAGYNFQYPTLEAALRAIFSKE